MKELLAKIGEALNQLEPLPSHYDASVDGLLQQLTDALGVEAEELRVEVEQFASERGLASTEGAVYPDDQRGYLSLL